MMALELIKENDHEYPSVCKQTIKMYQNTLNVLPVSLPRTFISLFDETGLAVGNVGIWHGQEKSKFLTEAYCVEHDSEMHRQYRRHNVRSRYHLAEACSYSTAAEYRNSSLPVFIIALMFRYLYYSGVKALVLTEAVTITKLFRKIGVRSAYICHAEARFMDVSADVQAQWERVYFKKLKPKCGTVNVLAAYRSCLESGVYDVPDVQLGKRFQEYIRASKLKEPMYA